MSIGARFVALIVGVSVAIGSASAGTCPWDCGDGNGCVGTTDLLALLAQWGGAGTCDFDGGGVGTTDLLEMLANWGGCPSCGLPTAGSCCVANGTPGCDDPACCEAVCDVDPSCCDVAWDAECAGAAQVLCGGCGTPACGDPGAGDCCLPNGTPACDDFICCDFICNVVDPFCCEVTWDAVCAQHAMQFCVCN